MLRDEQGLRRRLDQTRSAKDRGPRESARDAALQATVDSLRAEWRQLADMKPATGALDADLVEIRWMLEELRVSFFAEPPCRASPVSEKRIVMAMDRISA